MFASRARVADYPHHLSTFDYIGTYRYFLTFCTCNRQPAFLDADAVAIVHAQILRACSDKSFLIHAYCYMPDHLHMLVEGTAADSTLKGMIARAKQYSGFYYKQAFGKQLWQRYGYERTLRHDEETLVIARYIVANPIRASLANSLGEYPHWGSSTWTREQLIDYVRAG